jgi:hypothetical protein
VGLAPVSRLELGVIICSVHHGLVLRTIEKSPAFLVPRAISNTERREPGAPHVHVSTNRSLHVEAL